MGVSLLNVSVIQKYPHKNWTYYLSYTDPYLHWETEAPKKWHSSKYFNSLQKMIGEKFDKIKLKHADKRQNSASSLTNSIKVNKN